MKLNDLIFNRDKLRKYDELKEWEENFSKDELYLGSTCAFFGANEDLTAFIPDDIREIIIKAIRHKIVKLDEE